MGYLLPIALYRFFNLVIIMQISNFMKPSNVWHWMGLNIFFKIVALIIVFCLAFVFAGNKTVINALLWVELFTLMFISWRYTNHYYTILEGKDKHWSANTLITIFCLSWFIALYQMFNTM